MRWSTGKRFVINSTQSSREGTTFQRGAAVVRCRAHVQSPHSQVALQSFRRDDGTDDSRPHFVHGVSRPDLRRHHAGCENDLAPKKPILCGATQGTRPGAQEQKENNRLKSKVCCRVEHIYIF